MSTLIHASRRVSLQNRSQSGRGQRADTVASAYFLAASRRERIASERASLLRITNRNAFGLVQEKLATTRRLGRNSTQTSKHLRRDWWRLRPLSSRACNTSSQDQHRNEVLRSIHGQSLWVRNLSLPKNIARPEREATLKVLQISRVCLPSGGKRPETGDDLRHHIHHGVHVSFGGRGTKRETNGGVGHLRTQSHRQQHCGTA